jgi:hypothetical protein
MNVTAALIIELPAQTAGSWIEWLLSGRQYGNMNGANVPKRDDLNRSPTFQQAGTQSASAFSLH